MSLRRLSGAQDRVFFFSLTSKKIRRNESVTTLLVTEERVAFLQTLPEPQGGPFDVSIPCNCSREADTVPASSADCVPFGMEAVGTSASSIPSESYSGE